MKMSEGIWLGGGLFAQAMFFLRFFIQWIISEKKKQSVIPVSFWYLSLLGATGLLAYSFYRRDLVFILGQLAGLLLYSRNLYFIHRSSNKPPVV